MVSIWWVVCAFLLGGIAGLLVFALTSMAAKQNERAAEADKVLQHVHLRRLKLEGSWRT